MGKAKRTVPTSVKNEQLIEKRRADMIKGAVYLFKTKGYHKTTTREIAAAAGFSIGTLYEYIQTKEDVLLLVCDRLFDEINSQLEAVDFQNGTRTGLETGIRVYFQTMDQMRDEAAILHQEAKALSEDVLPYMKQRERSVVTLLEQLIESCIQEGTVRMPARHVRILAQSIFIQGQMWEAHRHMLEPDCTLEEYAEAQIGLILNGIASGKQSAVKH